jgi:hypothetical protein
MPGTVAYDAYNHISGAPGATLPCIALANSPSATVGIGPLALAGTGGAGAGATTAYPGGTGTGSTAVDTLGYRPNDSRGSFILAAAGTPVAGAVAQVNFAQPYAGPVNVVASAVDLTASPQVSIAVGAVLAITGSGATAGFQLATTPALTAAHSYLISYEVNP